MKKLGEQFLHQKDTKLHTAEPVEHEQKRKKRKGEKTRQKPAEKISDWLKVIEKTHMGHRDNPKVVNKIKEYYHKQHVVKPKDMPKSYFDNQRRLAREQGHGDIEITPEMKEQLIEVIVSDQKSTLDNWIEYFISPDSDSFPIWVKYWAFNGMLKLSSFDKEKKRFSKRDKKTVAPFPDLNREALAYVVDALVKKVEQKEIDQDDPEFKKLLTGANFGKLYAWAIEKVTPAEEHELANTKGEWVKYDKNSDHMPLVESLQGHGTGWCTAGESTARVQLKGGDFHIYYSNDKGGKSAIPRLALRMEESQIAEVRGIAPDQNIDKYMAETDILGKKLKEFGTEGEQYQKKSEDMKRLTEIEKKTSAGKKLSREDLVFLYEIENPIQGFGYQKDPRVQEILEQRNPQEDAPVIFDCQPEQIAHTEEEVNEDTKAYIGSLFDDFFNKIPKTLEHIYTRFPEKQVWHKTLIIDRDTPLDQQVKAGEYDWVNAGIKKFEIKGEGKEEQELVLVNIDRVMSTDQVEAEIARLGLQVPEVADILAVGAQYPDLQRKHFIVALLEAGSRFRSSDGDVVVPVLHEDGDGRGLDVSYYGFQWGDRCGFLARRK